MTVRLSTGSRQRRLEDIPIHLIHAGLDIGNQTTTICRICRHPAAPVGGSDGGALRRPARAGLRQEIGEERRGGGGFFFIIDYFFHGLQTGGRELGCGESLRKLSNRRLGSRVCLSQAERVSKKEVPGYAC